MTLDVPAAEMEVDVDTITAAGVRLEQATGLPAILDAAYDAFEDMLPAIEAQQDPGSAAFTAFVMSGASAANGRDAIAAAPSLPAATHYVVTAAGMPTAVTAQQAAAALTGLSRVLTAARAAIRAGPGPDGHPTREPARPDVQPSPLRELPGPVERILQDLGVTSTELLHHAAVIDQAGERLILDAAQATDTRQPFFGTASLSRSAGTAEIINHLLAVGSPRAAALLHPPPPRAARPARTDPDHRAKGQRRQPGQPVARPTPELEAER
jgi:hypothetical protein